MGKVGRLFCIFTPMALTLASFICIILVGLGTTNKNSTALSNLYFFGADTSGFKANETDILKNTNLDAKLNKLLTAETNATLADFYIVGLWGYCSGDKHDNVFQVQQCSKPQSSFYFNPVDVWGLQNSSLQQEFPAKLQSGLNTYHKVANWMFIAYVVAFVATLVELIVGAFAVCSRWGSLVTTTVSCISGLFIFLASLTATITFSVLAGAFDSVLKPYGIKASLGGPMMITTWLAVAFSWAAGIFWLLSTCCCSGRSSSPANKGRKGTKAEKTPYTYERVAGPFGQQQPAQQRAMHGEDTVPLQPYKAQAYEPYRHENV